VPANERFALRKTISALDATMGIVEKSPQAYGLVDLVKWKRARATIRSMIDYAPSWVLVAVAFALGLGTMIGWKRIVVTVGEKIGKEYLGYAQGAAAEIVAMTTIGVSAVAGLPVSTKHVLSSGIAGTMVAKKSGLQPKTVRSIGLAWVLTLPVTMVLSGTLFLLLRLFF
jgi:PiT family inorganic phosphate transporter